jgi:hypothetical protein
MRLLFALAVFALVGCAEPPAIEQLSGPRPAWADQGGHLEGGLFHKRTFYGAGSAEGLPDPKARRAAADQRARAELAKVLRAFTARLTDGENKLSLQLWDEITKPVAAAEPVQRWTSADGSQEASLYALTLEELERSVQGLPWLSPQVRAQLLARGRSAFDVLRDAQRAK